MSPSPSTNPSSVIVFSLLFTILLALSSRRHFTTVVHVVPLLFPLSSRLVFSNGPPAIIASSYLFIYFHSVTSPCLLMSRPRSCPWSRYLLRPIIFIFHRLFLLHLLDSYYLSPSAKPSSVVALLTLDKCCGSCVSSLSAVVYPVCFFSSHWSSLCHVVVASAVTGLTTHCAQFSSHVTKGL
jgi:hypothetical protein